MKTEVMEENSDSTVGNRTIKIGRILASTSRSKDCYSDYVFALSTSRQNLAFTKGIKKIKKSTFSDDNKENDGKNRRCRFRASRRGYFLLEENLNAMIATKNESNHLESPESGKEVTIIGKQFFNVF